MTDVAPVLEKTLTDFTAVMTGGSEFTLSNYREKNVVLYFYPKDNTPGCTMESLHFRDLYAEFQSASTEIFGISRDSLRSHENFKTKLDLPFELITDPDEILCSCFDVIKSKMMYGKKVRGIERSTFVIDGDGKLVKEWRGLKVPGHVEEILGFVRTLA